MKDAKHQVSSDLQGMCIYKTALVNAATAIIANMTPISNMVVQGKGEVTITREMQLLHDAAAEFLTKEFKDE